MPFILGLPPEKICEKIWPQIQEMFVPWIVPYSMQNLKDNMATWIQQLADDRSILLPWINADGNFALKILNAFKECISFILHSVPGDVYRNCDVFKNCDITCGLLYMLLFNLQDQIAFLAIYGNGM